MSDALLEAYPGARTNGNGILVVRIAHTDPEHKHYAVVPWGEVGRQEWSKHNLGSVGWPSEFMGAPTKFVFEAYPPCIGPWPCIFYGSSPLMAFLMPLPEKKNFQAVMVEAEVLDAASKKVRKYYFPCEHGYVVLGPKRQYLAATPRTYKVK